MTEQLTTPARAVTPGTVASAAAVGTLSALLGTSLVFLAARVADLELVVTPPGQSRGSVTYAALAGAVAAAGVAGYVGALVLERLEHGRRWFMGLATLVLLGSLASPIAAAEEVSTALVLGTMHLIVGACLIPPLARRMKGDKK